MAKKLFKPGQSGNPNGRPKGVPNKDKRRMIECIYNYLNDEENWQKFTDALNALKPRDYVNAYMKLIEFIVPKQRSQTQEYEGEKINFNVNVVENQKEINSRTK